MIDDDEDSGKSKYLLVSPTDIVMEGEFEED